MKVVRSECSPTSRRGQRTSKNGNEEVNSLRRKGEIKVGEKRVGLGQLGGTVCKVYDGPYGGFQLLSARSAEILRTTTLRERSCQFHLPRKVRPRGERGGGGCNGKVTSLYPTSLRQTVSPLEVPEGSESDQQAKTFPTHNGTALSAGQLFMRWGNHRSGTKLLSRIFQDGKKRFQIEMEANRQAGQNFAFFTPKSESVTSKTPKYLF